MKKLIALLIAMIMILGLVSCGGGDGGETEPEEKPPVDTSSGGESGTGSGSGSGTGGDLTDDPIVTPPDIENVDIPTASDVLNNNFNVFDDVEYKEQTKTSGFYDVIDVDVSKEANNITYKIQTGGAYRLFGKSINGCIYVKAPDENVYLILDGLDLTNMGSAPAIYAEDCKSVTVILTEGSVNYLRDSSKNGENGVLRVRSCNLTLDGKGTLNVVANRKHGISNTKEITIKGGIYNITTPTTDGHAIYGKLGLQIDSGSFDINAGKSGFKSGDVEDDGTIVSGYITINYTKAIISCGTNAFNCQGPVQINGGYFKINANTGNGIDATEDINISNATLIINSSKSAITTDKDKNVVIGGNTNLKLETTGNGISATNISIATQGFIYIKTTATYELYDEASDTSETKPDLFVLENGYYVAYDESKHDSKKLYTRRNCKGLNADDIKISSGVIGIDSFEDAINTTSLDIIDATIVLNTLADGVEAKNVTINATITVLNSQKGIRGEESLTINGGLVTVNALTDSLNSDNAIIEDGIVYLFDKIDKGTEGTVNVNGGTVLMLSTTKSAQYTSGTQRYRSGKVTNLDLCNAGSWMKVTLGENSVVLYLPKDYTNKMAFYYSDADATSKITIEFGTYEKGEEVNPFVYKDGTFTTEKSEQI
ncbi:MAG: carbohydrate-binding domain-containing protein [Clostridia bacterium]|nr:carbohydrate-binding domain-containing protein [Clostridia bacterium]